LEKLRNSSTNNSTPNLKDRLEIVQKLKDLDIQIKKLSLEEIGSLFKDKGLAGDFLETIYSLQDSRVVEIFLPDQVCSEIIDK